MTYNRNPFQVGDLVYIKTGHAPREVTDINGGYLHTRYTRPQDQHYPPLKPKHHTHFEFYDTPTPTSKEPTMPKLYEVLETAHAPSKFGTYLATAANGDIVLDFKTHTAAYAPTQIKEVIPFTLRVRALNASCGKDYTVTLPNNLEVNDVILNTAVTPPEFSIVEAVDTKKRDRPTLTYRKVMFA